MQVIFQMLLGPATPFVACPELAFVPLACYGLLLIWLIRTGRPEHRFNYALCLLCMLLWGLFYSNEQNARAHQYNIRVDLLILWPVVFIVSLLTLLTTWLTHTRPAPAKPTE